MVSSTLILQLCQHGEGALRSAHDRVTSLHYKKSKAVTVHIFGHTSIMEICITNMVYLIQSTDALGIFEQRKEVQAAQASSAEEHGLTGEGGRQTTAVGPTPDSPTGFSSGWIHQRCQAYKHSKNNQG